MSHTRTLGLVLVAMMLLTLLGLQRGALGAESLEERLRAVEDRLAIEQLMMRYAAALNTDDADTYVSLFTPDATFELRRQADEPPFLWPMRHVTTNDEIDVAGDTATVRAFFMNDEWQP